MKQKDQPIDNKSIDPDSFDAATAQAAIEADKLRRQDACKSEFDKFVAELQARHKCDLVIVEVRVNGQTTQLQIGFAAR